MKDYHFKEIFTLLNKAAKNFKRPVVTEVASIKKSPYMVLISCILSLRTKDATTAQASNRLFAKADNPKEMLNLSTKTIQKLIYPVGFYKVKSKNIKKVSKIILNEYK